MGIITAVRAIDGDNLSRGDMEACASGIRIWQAVRNTSHQFDNEPPRLRFTVGCTTESRGIYFVTCTV